MVGMAPHRRRAGAHRALRADLLRSALAGRMSPPKYGNRRIRTEEGWFDSQREWNRWLELKLLARAGEIANLRRQVPFELIPRIGGERPTFFVADFVYDDVKTGKQVVEDSKGYRNRLYMLKRKLMLFRHNIAVMET